MSTTNFLPPTLENDTRTEARLTTEQIVTLRGWVSFLETQTAALDDRIFRYNGLRFRANECGRTNLELDNHAQRERVEEAVLDFARSGVWPKGSFAELRLLLLRVFTAHRLVLGLVNQELDLPRCIPAIPHDLRDHARMIQWLLIETWNDTDGRGLKARIDAFCEQGSSLSP